MTTRIVTLIDGEAGAVAASLVAGKRGLISDATSTALRASGLYHVVSISGLHMAIFSGGVFTLLRLILSLSPTFAARYPVKAISALAALALAAAYVGLAGLAVATVRSFLMTAMVLGAAACRRRVITRRNLSMAAAAILLFAPESILDPGFQMSFAAVALLVAWVDRPRPSMTTGTAPTLVRRAIRVVLDLVVVTLIASLATAPFSAFHFHRLTLQGVAANLLATPLVSIVIMPSALLALVLEPFGYGAPLWRICGAAVRVFLLISDVVAAWPGASIFVPQFPSTSLVAFSSAIVMTALLRTRLVMLACLPVAIGLAGVVLTPRPIAIIGADGHAALVRREGSVALVARRRDAFLAREWLLSLGDRRLPDDPSLLSTVTCDEGGCAVPLRTGRVLMLDWTWDALEEDCGHVAILVTPHVAPQRCAESGLVIDRERLATAAVIQVFETEAGLRMEAARPPGMNRPWGRNLPAPTLSEE